MCLLGALHFIFILLNTFYLYLVGAKHQKVVYKINRGRLLWVVSGFGVMGDICSFYREHRIILHYDEAVYIRLISHARLSQVYVFQGERFLLIYL